MLGGEGEVCLCGGTLPEGEKERRWRRITEAVFTPGVCTKKLKLLHTKQGRSESNLSLLKYSVLVIIINYNQNTDE